MGELCSAIWSALKPSNTKIIKAEPTNFPRVLRFVSPVLHQIAVCATFFFKFTSGPRDSERAVVLSYLN